MCPCQSLQKPVPEKRGGTFVFNFVGSHRKEMIEANIEGSAVKVRTIEAAKYSIQGLNSLLPPLNEESPRIPEAFLRLFQADYPTTFCTRSAASFNSIAEETLSPL
jgi:hypothetical protein